MKTPVLLIMFTRSSTFEKVFEQVKIAKPEKLYLYQDGPRQERYDSDMAGIMKCREIASEINWDCQVKKQFIRAIMSKPECHERLSYSESSHSQRSMHAIGG